MSDLPTLSVVVPTYNRRQRLERVLAALADQDIGEPFEVVVVSDGSTDDTDEYLASGSTPLPVVARFQDNQGPAGARNLGVATATADLVVFVDDDVVADPGLLRTHRDAHRRLGDRVVVIGPMLNPVDHEMSSWVAWEQEMLAKQYAAMVARIYDATARQFYTGNASLRREHVDAVGGFDPTFRRAEDIELAYRLTDHGLTFHYEPAAVGYHYAERSYDAWRATAYTYGRNDMVFARDLDRADLIPFVSEGYYRHHPLLRFLARRSVHSPRWRSASNRTLEAVVAGPIGRRLPRLTRYALSGVYATEYHCGVADELGSPMEFDRLIVKA